MTRHLGLIGGHHQCQSGGNFKNENLNLFGAVYDEKKHLRDQIEACEKIVREQNKTIQRLRMEPMAGAGRPMAGAGTSAESIIPITRPIAAKSKLKKTSSKRVSKIESKPIAKKAHKSLTCKELRAIAEEKGISGISKMKKSELIKYLSTLGVIKK